MAAALAENRLRGTMTTGQDLSSWSGAGTRSAVTQCAVGPMTGCAAAERGCAAGQGDALLRATIPRLGAIRLLVVDDEKPSVAAESPK